MESYESHPAATAFPLMEGAEYARLVEDIKENGLRHPVVLWDGGGEWLILDGRNRAKACAELGIKPKTEVYGGDDPYRYVVSVNVARRHMNESQRAIVAARLATLQHGGDRSSGKSAACPTQAEAAELLNVGERTLRAAKSVIDNGTPEMVAAVERGDIAASRAAELSKLSDEQQKEAIEDAKTQPVKRHPAEQRDRWMSREILLNESMVRGLQALIDMAEDHGNPLAREGIKVLRKMAPQVGS
jgi:ParB-like chromosome segregation protein Spo0J